MTAGPSSSELWEAIADAAGRHGGIRQQESWILGAYHLGNWARSQSGVKRRFASKLHGAVSMALRLTTNCDVNAEARLGKRVHLIHGYNVHIHPTAVIGDDVGIMHDVTIGTNMGREGAPKIGDRVFIGAGAKLLGDIIIGEGAIIAANSLVTTNVPAGATAIGVPARVMRYTGRAPVEPENAPSK